MIFYRLSDGEKFPNANWAEEMGFKNTIFCPVNKGHQRAGERMNQLIIALPSSRIGDFVWTWYSECIITDRVVNLFKEAGFTGYVLKPVIVAKIYKYYKEKDIGMENGKPVGITRIIRDRKPKPISPLWELVVTGKGGDAHPKSCIRLKYECAACGAKEYTDFKKGLFIDEAQWDGSDFFTVWPLPKFIIVTERVKNFILEYKLSNCKLTPTEDLIGDGEKGTLAPC